MTNPVQEVDNSYPALIGGRLGPDSSQILAGVKT